MHKFDRYFKRIFLFGLTNILTRKSFFFILHIHFIKGKSQYRTEGNIRIPRTHILENRLNAQLETTFLIKTLGSFSHTQY